LPIEILKGFGDIHVEGGLGMGMLRETGGRDIEGNWGSTF
jgi:hypothetical protein